MEVKRKIRKKANVIKDSCVACGACIKVCPRDAIKIVAGVYAKVDESKCIGCTLCAKECPAYTIEMISKEEVVEYAKANTMGTLKYCATMAAIAIPEVSAVSILSIFSSLNSQSFNY